MSRAGYCSISESSEQLVSPCGNTALVLQSTSIYIKISYCILKAFNSLCLCFSVCDISDQFMLVCLYPPDVIQGFDFAGTGKQEDVLSSTDVCSS